MDKSNPASFQSALLQPQQRTRMQDAIDCRYKYTDRWGKWTPRAHRGADQEPIDAPISLPLPSFPPALDFDAYNFALPPSYEEAVDIEKALCSSKSSQFFNTNVSPSYTSSKVAYHGHSVLPEDEQPTSQRRLISLFRYVRYRALTVYRRLFGLVSLLNSIGLLILLWQLQMKGSISLNTLATFASSNFLVAILVRQDYLISLLFRCAWLVPWSASLRLRKMAARVYCYGGLHSGAAIAGTLWWLAFNVAICWAFVESEQYTLPIITIAWIASMILLTIVFLALPNLRQRHHDSFEITHRFFGWLSIILFWIQVVLLAHYASEHSATKNSPGTNLTRNPTFWNLSCITILLLYPWLRLRRWTFIATPLSSHAVRLSFTNPIHKFSCLSISSSPLREWHPFATFPSADLGDQGASMVISDAGDWTNLVIRTAQDQSKFLVEDCKHKRKDVKMHFWVKSHPKAGVLSLSLLFPRVLILTTGSGIGPSLSSLLDRPPTQHARLVWSTRSPLATYGPDILGLVDKADPDALIIDTDEMGRPELLELAWGMYKREQLEAVFVLSNEKVVKRVVGGLEKRGVPAFGPIWDS